MSSAPELARPARAPDRARASITPPRDFVPFPKSEVEQSIVARFERQAFVHANRPAVVTRSTTLTYAELNRSANRIAHGIARMTPGEGAARVALFLEKEARYLAAIFGVLKAGHTYVPIDPAFPNSRNEYIIADSQAALIVTNSAHLAAAQALTRGAVPILNLDDLGADLPEHNPGRVILPDTLAYLIYTSGSTGKPKGVMQNHRNTLHGCMRRTNLQCVAPGDRMTLFYSCSVMGSVYCIFGALLNGASLHPYDIREDGLDRLAEWLRAERITIYHSVASVFREFAGGAAGAPGAFDIRLVIFGGERVLASDIELVRTVFSPRCEFFTGLGSTETGTIRHLIIGPDTAFDAKVVPIGYPVDDMEIVLRDDVGQPVGPGEIGEITVRSRYNAVGYWNQPETTQRAFRRDPQDASYTSYHTGDMGYLNPDGLLEHRGRKDFQVKIRGFRVEISEVETSLLDQPTIAEAVVVAREINAENQLVAYIVARGADPIAVAEVRRSLQGRLPYYMVPTVFVQLAAIPRTPNNKVDRNALPAPDESNQLVDHVLVAPRTATEHTLVDIWKTLLRRNEVGSNHNFFDLGGHSLSATQMVSRIQERLRVKVSMRTVFEAASLEALARTIDASAPASAGAAPHSGLRLAPRDQRIPLSFAQRRMWIIDRLHPGSAAYNISNTVRLVGPLDVGALEQALDTIVQRHETLRTVFPADEAGPWQHVLPWTKTTLAQTDLRHLPVEEREERARQIAQDELRRPHDLARGPLFQRQLVRIDDTTAVLVLVFNHIIYDNIWSSGIFFRELAASYAAFTAKTDPALPALPFQFADYACSQQAAAAAGAQGEHLAYWKKQLTPLPLALELPGDRPRPTEPTFRGGQISFQVPATVKSALADLARDESCTMFMLLLSAWQVLLHRYTQQEEFLVGTPTGRRYQTETEGMIGLFINTLVLRADCSGRPQFRELLRRVRHTTIDAFTHDELPFEDLVAALRSDRESGVAPLFQALFIHRHAGHAPWSIPGLKVAPVEAHPGGAKFDLTISMLEDERRLQGTLEYSSDLFDRATAERIVANFGALLAAIVARPDETIDQLDLLTANERSLVCDAWNQTAVSYPADRCAHQLFEQQARAHPDRTALVFEGAALSYRDLNRRANQLAARLRTLGVGPDVLVAIAVERSIELIVGLLGILKAGGAYVPLDPSFPAERIAYMIEDSNAPVLVTQTAVAARLPERGVAKVLLDEPWPAPGSEFDSDQAAATQPSHLAYVIYTSGSTGRPKGVQLTQQALVNFLCSMQREPGITPDDVLHAVTTVSFDIAALEIFLPLVSGARLVLASRETSLDPGRLRESLAATHSTILQATPVTWRMLLDHGWNGTPRLKVLCGGEAMGTDLAERLLRASPEVWNLYGPTETTIWSTVARIQTKEDALFVGHPIANTEILILSPLLRPQPLGVPGELHIGGDGLARGYLNRAELTQEKFIAHPLQPGKRLYKTGDLARRRPDGTIEFLGRMDNQVKLRGYRIELGEIEAALSDMDGVAQAVVHAREDTPGDKRLVAYFTRSNGKIPTSAEFVTFLKDRLPDYMVPSAFVSLDAFPLTPNRKVDRKALPAPGGYASDAVARTFEEPVGATEIKLAALMASVLKLPRVGRTDNFFELGGQSLLAVQLQLRAEREFRTRLDLRTIFTAGTVADLARSVERTRESNQSAGTTLAASDEDTGLI